MITFDDMLKKELENPSFKKNGINSDHSTTSLKDS